MKVEEGFHFVEFSTQLSTTDHAGTKIQVPPTSESILQRSTWQSDIHEQKDAFDVQSDLNGSAVVKTWGIAKSPVGDLVASCITFHPSDQLEYTIAADNRFTVAVTRFSDNDRLAVNVPQTLLSVEGLYCSK